MNTKWLLCAFFFLSSCDSNTKGHSNHRSANVEGLETSGEKRESAEPPSIESSEPLSESSDLGGKQSSCAKGPDGKEMQGNWITPTKISDEYCREEKRKDSQSCIDIKTLCSRNVYIPCSQDDIQASKCGVWTEIEEKPLLCCPCPNC